MKNYRHPRTKLVPDIVFKILAVLFAIALLWQLVKWLYELIVN